MRMRLGRSAILLSMLSIGVAAPRTVAAQTGAHYRQAADVFEMLDNVSDWWPGYTDVLYREYWARHVGLSAADDTMLARYAALRTRHFSKAGQSNENPATSEGGLFTARATLSADRVGDVFYRSATIDDALASLDGVVSAEEIRFLRRFYAHFQSRYLPLVSAHERAVQASLAATNETLTSRAFADWLASVERFFDVPNDGYRYDALYVWWPDTLRVVANPRGRFLVVRALVKPGEALHVGDVVAHEAIHVIAARQPSPQKRALTDAFLRGCPANTSVGRLTTIEEPLAVVFGNMLFTRTFRPQRYRYARRWYGEPWVDVSAKLLFSPIVEGFVQGGRITDVVAEQGVQLCAALLSVRGGAPTRK